MPLPLFLSAALACLLAGLSHAAAFETIAGPVAARVVKVHDGDSFSVDALVWPGTVVSVAIRVRGIDAPELRSKCPHERWLAERAREMLARRLSRGQIRLSNIDGDKYYGRVLADVVLDDGTDLAKALLENRSVRPYGGKKREGWC